MRLIAAGLLVCLAACQSAPVPVPARRSAGLTLEEARALVAELEARQAGESGSDPLLAPKSLDDVLEILKRDQLDLFPAGVRYAERSTEPGAEALRAQIELAWGEAQLVLAEVFTDTSGRLKGAVRGLEIRVASGEATERESQRLAALAEMGAKSDALAEALTRLAAEHVGSGIRLAKDVIAKNPSDYVGYRVAADYYRLREDWEGFARMVERLEQANPGSNGLVFLRGTAALQRDRQPDEARKHFSDALANDPKFTRAQVQLVLSRTGARDTYAEYQKLRALNPHHQIVVWAGEAITAAFEEDRRGR